MTPDLNSFNWIVVNSSGGKDSQTALRHVLALSDAAGFPRDRVIVSHQCLGKMEWEGTLDLVRRQTDHYALRLEVTKYRDKNGSELSLLEVVKRRGKWPSSKQRYCTSEFKRQAGGRVLTTLHGRILNVYGFRAEESPARAKKAKLALNVRFSNSKREVFDWLPIHDWTLPQVWHSIRTSGVPHHRAYDLGMPRLSCVFCIFAPKPALMIAGRANPELLAQYVQVERDIGHTFQHNKPIALIAEAIANGEQPEATDGNWNM